MIMCIKCGKSAVEIDIHVQPHQHPEIQLQFAVMECGTCAYIFATEDQRRENERRYNELTYSASGCPLDCAQRKVRCSQDPICFSSEAVWAHS